MKYKIPNKKKVDSLESTSLHFIIGINTLILFV